ncbi:MAG: MBL fold metallo-hydrolase, partial [Solirubrobacterales bacterium]
SHLHGDHLLDLVPFAYALALGPGAEERSSKPRLLAPVGADAFFRRLCGTWGDENLIVNALVLEEYEPSSEARLGDVVVRTHPVPHAGPTHAIELITGSGGRIVFGSDGRYSEELVMAATGADLLIAEATLEDPDPAPPEKRVHMSASECGRLAREAGVSRLVLTHISDELDLARSLDLAREAFGGPVEIAAEGAAYEV